jgi:hypothetical protein
MTEDAHAFEANERTCRLFDCSSPLATMADLVSLKTMSSTIGGYS